MGGRVDGIRCVGAPHATLHVLSAHSRPCATGCPGAHHRTQAYEGTDRQARGAVLEVLRSGPADTFDWHDQDQLERALAGLLSDGLIVPELIVGACRGNQPLGLCVATLGDAGPSCTEIVEGPPAETSAGPGCGVWPGPSPLSTWWVRRDLGESEGTRLLDATGTRAGGIQGDAHPEEM